MPKHSVSSTIYVGRPDLIGLSEEVDQENIDAALASAAKTATEITVLGGFYSLKPLMSLFEAIPEKQRRNCRVRVAVGLEAKAMIPRTWSDMRELRATLLRLKFPNPEVRIVDNAPVHFHTKLFRFLNTTRPMWFIGSANPGSGRHELMVRLPGRHGALSAYVAAVFAKGVSVELAPPAASIVTLQDFFLSGMLCHKPPAPQLFTFNAFHFDPNDRERLSTALAGTSGVDHADPKAQGFGFDLRSGIGLPAEVARAGSGNRIQFRPYSIDTVLGWWMPRAYSDDIQMDVRKDEAGRERRLAEIGATLISDTGQAAAHQALKDHVASMEAFLDTHRIRARPTNDRGGRYEQFLTSRIKMLKDGETLRRYARSLTLTDMPDIWVDGSAVENFEESFFQDLAFRASGRRQPRIVKSLVKWLDDDSLTFANDFVKAMISQLKKKPWTQECWI